jgi:EAL domain-containing protein (putative c-di-GMP-specific phosphodiesterase class I)/GGDEF domain-containing protein
VSSGRLTTEAEVKNRFFPKLRSWIALGAPLELMSPLSVLRANFAVSAVAWCLEGLYLRWPGERTAVVEIAAAVGAAVWVGLMCVRRLGPTPCRILAAGETALVITTVWAGNGPGAALGFVPFALLPLLFVALYFSGRAAMANAAFASLGLWLALYSFMGIADSVVIAAATAIGLGVALQVATMLTTAVSHTGAADADTGLPNSVGLARHVGRWEGGHGYLLASLRVAGIDDARDAFGHGVGTELLRRVVEDLGQVIPGDAVIARIGSDELVVARPLPSRTAGHPEATGPGPADEVPADVAAAGHLLARTLIDGMAAGRYMVGSVEVSLRGHVGLEFAPWGGTEMAELLRRASLGAQRAAETGAHQHRWDRAEGTLTAEDLTLLADLRLAIDRGELRLAYQPQVDARTNRVVSAEALLRWQSERHGSVPPGRFIVLAERTGYIDRLTEWVLDEALDAQVRWRHTGVLIPISVNFSARTLTRPDLPTWIIGELAARDLPAEALAVEVTETAAAELLPAVQLLQPLHDRGVRVSIDDFGTGFTSLAALPHLPLDELKVDMSFVQRSGQSLADDAIVRSVRELAHRLDLDSVAEGVENDEIRRRMTEIGFDLLQGYHFSKPLFEEEFLAFARDAGCTLVDY